jgi:hypothetical protein
MIGRCLSNENLRTIHDSLELVGWSGFIKSFTEVMVQFKLSTADIQLPIEKCVHSMEE